MLNKTIKFFLENKLVTILVFISMIGWGLMTAPFDWGLSLPRDPVSVDAIPDIGENQQIIFTKWPGRSPQDIEDQISYPLTTSLLGIPGVKTIRSNSMFGFSSIYVIFNDDVEYYWSRSRILEKLNSLPAGALPDDVQPALGPDATALGQVFWYTLEGEDSLGNPTGGWGLDELRSIQDFYVRYGLASADGVSEVASIGGYVREYQIDVDPLAMKTYNITLPQVVAAIKKSNLDVGAQTMEINRVEYLVRGIGYIKNLEDIEQAVVKEINNVPIRIKDIAVVNTGPSERRGLLDKEGAEAVGGVVVARYGANPLEVINNVKEKIKEIEPGMPSKRLDDGTLSKVSIVPFYDRSGLIYETLGTLEDALSLEILITVLVILFMVANLSASLLISGLLPVAVLMVFIAMRYFGITANIVALSGIAIAIGTMVDLGIVLAENMLRHLDMKEKGKSLKDIIYKATSEVSGAIVTAVATTIVSFIPVFALQAAEGKLFSPLAYTKTFALVAALIVALFFVPTFASWFFGFKITRRWPRLMLNAALAVLGAYIGFSMHWIGWPLLVFALISLLREKYPDAKVRGINLEGSKLYTAIQGAIAIFVTTRFLAGEWMPLGVANSLLMNFAFVLLVVGFFLFLFWLFLRVYRHILALFLDHKVLFLTIPLIIVFLGLSIWMGFGSTFGWVASGFDKLGVNIRTTKVWSELTHTFPGVQEEFMPALDEGSFLLMPTSMPHTGVEQSKEYLRMLDMATYAIPEVHQVVGKAGRVESALDPAPISMYENIIHYKPEYVQDENGRKLRFKVNDEGLFLARVPGHEDSLRAVNKEEQPWFDTDLLIRDDHGQYFRQWRDEIKSPGDIWAEIQKVTRIPGLTSAPMLQPIQTRLIMLQTGMRAPIGIKIFGPDLKTIESFGLQIEKILQEVPAVNRSSVFADRIVGKPYLQMNIDRGAISRYGLNVKDVTDFIETAVGGIKLTSTLEGRERYPVRVRYPREFRTSPEDIRNMLIPTKSGAQIPLGDVVHIEFEKGPMNIKSENTFLTGYVLFDRTDEYSEVEAVKQADRFIKNRIKEGKLIVPAGVSFKFAGNYENSVRAQKRLSILIPIVLGIIFLILYFQFRSVTTTLMVFSGVAMAFAGGFLMIWFYDQSWFLNFNLMGVNMRELFQVHPINLSVAVWVGFIALFGIATDDGVLMGTYLHQQFEENKPSTLEEIRKTVIEGSLKRVRPAIMTTATTLLALLPVLTSSGKGSDIMIPMAIPAFGGMTVAIITMFIVPVLFSSYREMQLKKSSKSSDHEQV